MSGVSGLVDLRILAWNGGQWRPPEGINLPSCRQAWRGTDTLSVGTRGAAGVVAAVPSKQWERRSYRRSKVGSWWQGRKRRRSGVPWSVVVN